MDHVQTFNKGKIVMIITYQYKMYGHYDLLRIATTTRNWQSQARKKEISQISNLGYLAESGYLARTLGYNGLE